MRWCGRRLWKVFSSGDTQFTDRRIYSLPLECPLPVIAAMQGHAIGAGWALGMFSDVALFAEEGVYHSSYLELGFTPGQGDARFPYRLGERLGHEVLFYSRGRSKGAISESRAPSLDASGGGGAACCVGSGAWACVPLTRRVDCDEGEGVGAVDRCAAALSRSAELDMHQRPFIGNADVLARIRNAFSSLPSDGCQPIRAPGSRTVKAVGPEVRSGGCREPRGGADDRRGRYPRRIGVPRSWA